MENDYLCRMMKPNKIIAVIFSVLLAVSCSKESWEEEFIFGRGEASVRPGETNERPGGIVVPEVTRKVMLLYAAGHNNLGYTDIYIPKNIKDLKENWLPGSSAQDNILLIYSHLAKKPKNNKLEPTPSHLIRIYRDHKNRIISDTLKTYDKTIISASAAQLRQVLTDVKENFAAASYGMVFSSHATGYMPAGYSTEYKFTNTLMRQGQNHPTYTIYTEKPNDPLRFMVKSIGHDEEDDRTYEMNLPEFASAIPMKLDYIVFDACFMGGVEVAYELRDKCNHIVFSQAEIVADGFYYPTLTQRLLQSEQPDLKGVCEDYFNLYKDKRGWEKSATVSLVRCDKVEELVSICADIFDKCSNGLKALASDSSEVQQYHRDPFWSNFHSHLFFDLKSIAEEAGATEEQLTALQTALDDCIAYKTHTEKILDEVDIHTFSGLSMYIPGTGTSELDKYYRTLAWNKATKLVED